MYVYKILFVMKFLEKMFGILVWGFFIAIILTVVYGLITLMF